MVQQHKRSYGSLRKEYGFEKIVNIINFRLEQRIFESELKAKTTFPELFQLSPARDVQRTASENNAARSEAEALEEIASLEGKNGDENGLHEGEGAKDGNNPL